jgi:uroporphyrin-III C-methyltransferase
MLFGRAQEEIAALKTAGIEYEVVPGITAALGAAAQTGISLTQRGIARSVAFVTARVGDGEAPNDWARSAVLADTTVIYMGAGQAAEIVATLIAHGVDPATPLVLVENASLPEARRYFMPLSQLGCIASLGITGPAVIMLGQVFAPGIAQESFADAA